MAMPHRAVTSRDRPKPASYLNLKNNKRASKCQSIDEPFYEKTFERKSHNAEKKQKGGTLRNRPILYVTRETFLVQFLGPTGTIWRLLEIL